MGLFSLFNIGGQALSANETALQVIGQNIANASNPDYTRQRVSMATTPAQDVGYAQLGTGVVIAGIERVMNAALEERIDDAESSYAEFNARLDILSNIESIFNELSETDLSSALGAFYDALDELSTSPNDNSVRLELLSAGESLAASFNYILVELNNIRENADNSVQVAVSDINALTASIADLNQQIMVAENGGINQGDANDLRDRRDAMITEISQIVDVRAIETSDGAVNILAGSDFLVCGNSSYDLMATQDADNGVLVSTVEFEHNGADLTINGGILDGLIYGRDTDAVSFITDINTMAQTLINEVNLIHSEGLGIDGLSDVTSESAVSSALTALDAAGLNFDVVNGSFMIHVRNENTGETDIVNISVDLDDIGTDSTLTSIVAEINTELTAVLGTSPPITASVTNTNKLNIASSSDNYTFSFADDTSGFLAAIGMNTFFTGYDALTMGVNSALTDNPDLIAAASQSAPGGNANALRLAQLREEQVFDNGSATFDEYYQGVVSTLGVEVSSAQDKVENQSALLLSLQNEHEAISGVNIDEETINLLQYQRGYQAAAQLIAVADNLLETLLNIL